MKFYHIISKTKTVDLKILVFFFCQTVLLREIRDGNITLEKWKKKKKNRENSSNSKSKMGA